MSNFIIEHLDVSIPYCCNEKHKGEAKQLDIIRDFNLNIEVGEFVVILGPSGCGKSTLLSAISGLKEPTQGRVIYNNQSFFDKERQINLATEKRNIGFVFQSYALWPHLSVYQNLAFPLKVRRFSRSEIKDRVHKFLDIVHMGQHINSYPDELSGGERQRIALARSLIYNPSLLLLDEPLANIDANLKQVLLKEIKSIHSHFNLTTLYVTHDQSEAFEIADRIVIMKEGKIMQQGTPRHIYEQSSNEFVAKFIGNNNVLKGEALQSLSLSDELDDSSVATIRPEDIIVTSNGMYCGVIKDLVYLGARIRCNLETRGISLITYLEPDSGFVCGDTLDFNIKHYHLI